MNVFKKSNLVTLDVFKTFLKYPSNLDLIKIGSNLDIFNMSNILNIFLKRYCTVWEQNERVIDN